MARVFAKTPREHDAQECQNYHRHHMEEFDTPIPIQQIKLAHIKEPVKFDFVCVPISGSSLKDNKL